MELKFYIPFKITSSVSGYESLLRLQNDHAGYHNKAIQLSFKNVTWLEANLTAIVGAVIEELENRKNKVKLIDCEIFHNKNDILSRNGFFPYYGVELNPNRYGST